MIEDDQAKYLEEKKKIQNQKLEEERRFYLQKNQQYNDPNEQRKKELQVILQEIEEMACKYSMKFLHEKYFPKANSKHWGQANHDYNHCYQTYV